MFLGVVVVATFEATKRIESLAKDRYHQKKGF
jgi:hypothetical protein